MTKDSEPHQTFVFADLAGFTALTEAHGDLQAADLARDFCSRVAELSRNYGAEALKDIGDAVLLRVALAEQAIDLSLAVLEMTDRLDGYPAVRIGMHSGPAVERDGEWIGATINVAARVAAAAAGGEVVLTAATKKLAEPHLNGIELEALGEQRFRNVARPVRLYRVRALNAAPGGRHIDPVCRMIVAPGRGVRVEIDGEELRFCSLECVSRYSADPEAYGAEH